MNKKKYNIRVLKTICNYMKNTRYLISAKISGLEAFRSVPSNPNGDAFSCNQTM